jgi:Mycobacterium 19 kDa lipoprotein antigen
MTTRSTVSLVLATWACAAALSACGNARHSAVPNDDPVLCPNHSCVVPPEGGQRSESAPSSSTEKYVDGTVTATDIKASLDGKDIPITYPTTCKWKYGHTLAEVSSKPSFENDRTPRINEAPQFIATIVTDPVKVNELQILGVRPHEWVSAYYKGAKVNSYGMPENAASATVNNGHYVLSGQISSGGWNDGRPGDELGKQYAQFEIQFTC